MLTVRVRVTKPFMLAARRAEVGETLDVDPVLARDMIALGKAVALKPDALPALVADAIKAQTERVYAQYRPKPTFGAPSESEFGRHWPTRM